MTKEELLEMLSEFDGEDLQVALQAAHAARKTRAKGLYFLHHFFEERRFEAEEKGWGVKIPISSLVMNPGQMVHGGVTAFLADNAMGMASFMEKQRPGVTLDLSVRYHRPARGNHLTALGQVVSAGSLVNSMRAEIRDDTGLLVATSTGSFYHRKAKES